MPEPQPAPEPTPQPAPAPTPAPAPSPSPAPTTDPAPAAKPATGDVDWKAEAEKWKGLARKHEDQAKANAGAAREAKTLEERLADLEKRNADSEGRALRAEVAAAKNLPLSLAKRLTGTTREELEADAEELAAEMAKKDEPKPTPAGRQPTEKLRPGAVPGAEKEPDYDDIAKRVAKGPLLGRR